MVIVDEFLDWCEKHRAPDTYRWYKDRLESFCKHLAQIVSKSRGAPAFNSRGDTGSVSATIRLTPTAVPDSE